MDDTINITLKIPKAIIETSRDITLRIVLEDDNSPKSDLTFSTDETTEDALSNFTVDNWMGKLDSFLSNMGFCGRPKKLIIDAVNLAIERESSKYIFSELSKKTGDNSKEIQNKIANQINNNRITESLLKSFGTKLTPAKLIKTLVEIVESQIKNAP